MSKESQTKKSELVDKAAEMLAELFVMAIDERIARQNKRSKKLLEKSNEENNEKENEQKEGREI